MLICLDQRNGTGCQAENRDAALHCKQCGRSLRYALELHNPGTVIGVYTIMRKVGHGGFSVVYEAEDQQHRGLYVALKETDDPNSIATFRDEFTVLRSLRHSNLPQYLGMYEHNGRGYLVMEFVRGQSLEDVLNDNGGPLAESLVVSYGQHICEALAYLHNQKQSIVHRDVKPANIRITPAGLIKLVDFGLMKQGDVKLRLSDAD